MRLSGPGPDGISIKLMKDGSNVLSPILSSLLNLSLTTGQYPNELKEAKISPIFKGGDATDMNNYRQISILNSINKIFEKIVYQQIIKHVNENNIMTKEQYGFLQNISTQDTIISFIDQIIKNLDDKTYTIALYLDLCKAFDSIDHKILLDKLKFYGFRNE